MHSCASICIYLHSTALITIWSVLGFQQTIPSQFLIVIQNRKTIISTEPKSSARTGIISNPVLELVLFPKSSARTGIISQSNARTGIIFKIQCSNWRCFKSNFKSVYIFLWKTEFRLGFLSQNYFSFEDPSSDSGVCFKIIFPLKKPSFDSGFPSNHFFLLLIWVPTRDLLQIIFFFLWKSEFRLRFSFKLLFLLLIRVPTRVFP